MTIVDKVDRLESRNGEEDDKRGGEPCKVARTDRTGKSRFLTIEFYSRHESAFSARKYGLFLRLDTPCESFTALDTSGGHCQTKMVLI